MVIGEAIVIVPTLPTMTIVRAAGSKARSALFASRRVSTEVRDRGEPDRCGRIRGRKSGGNPDRDAPIDRSAREASLVRTDPPDRFSGLASPVRARVDRTVPILPSRAMSRPRSESLDRGGKPGFCRVGASRFLPRFADRFCLTLDFRRNYTESLVVARKAAALHERPSCGRLSGLVGRSGQDRVRPLGRSVL